MLEKFTMLAGALALLAASDASALTRIDLTGTVYHTSGDAKPVFANGTKASAWFEYDESAVGRAWHPGGKLDPSVFFYQNAPTGGSMTVGDYTITFSGSSRMFVTNQEQASYGLIDRVLFDDHDPIGGALNGRAVDAVSISWQDNSATALTNLSLPSTQATFDKFDSVRASIDWTPYIRAEHRVSVDFTIVNVAAVPEPASWAMMLIGFGAMGWRMRRSGRPKATAMSEQVSVLA